MNQRKVKGFLPDSRLSDKGTPVSLWCKLRQRLVLRRLLRRIRTIRKLLEDFEKIQVNHFETMTMLSEDTPKGRYHKIGVEK